MGSFASFLDPTEKSNRYASLLMAQAILKTFTPYMAMTI